jgi:hypothetical protein
VVQNEDGSNGTQEELLSVWQEEMSSEWQAERNIESLAGMLFL